jgi:glycosyltransferase involved in cell wall biosynthesis
MNIVYIHQYFKTPEKPGGTRSYWIAKKLLDKGHKVTMVTMRVSSNGKSAIESKDGIDIHYLNVVYSQRMTFLQRMKAYFEFATKALLLVSKLPKIDLVIATSTPLTVAIPALYLNIRKKVPFVFEVRDLWPEVPIKMGIITNPIVIYLSKKLEAFTYKRASHIVALSPGMREGVLKHVEFSKVSMIPNMSKNDIFFPREKNLEVLRNMNLGEKTFKIVYFGTIGLANGLKYILRAAELLKENEHFEFVLVGEGSKDSEIQRYVKEKGLRNVVLFPRVPANQIGEVVNLCNVTIVPLLNIPVLYMSSPNKLFDSLSAGKPVIVNSAGWTKDLVEAAKCGYYVDPENPCDLIDKLWHLNSRPDLLIEMGRNARVIAEEKYDKSILTEQFAEIIDQVISQPTWKRCKQ